jgi:hypothetical protein
MQTWIQKSFAPLKRILPTYFANFIRSAVTAAFAPFYDCYRLGFFRSSFAMRSVDRHGRPLPWYTYACINFLKEQCFAGRNCLEFGAGQSTYWWACVAASVVAIDANEKWFKEVQRSAPPNTAVHFASAPDALTCISSVRKILASYADIRFDIIVIDGLYRAEMIDIAIPLLTQDGAIICDNTDGGYGFFEGFKDKGFQRVDFYGLPPGVVLPGCTSIFFRNKCFLFDNSRPIKKYHELVA